MKMPGIGYSNLQEETEASNSAVSSNTPWTASFHEDLTTSLADPSLQKQSPNGNPHTQDGVTSGVVTPSARNDVTSFTRQPKDNVKYTALKPTNVTELSDYDLDREEVGHDAYDSCVRIKLTSEARKSRVRKFHAILCALVCAGVALVAIGLIYVFVVLPSEKGTIVYPDGKTHSADLVKLKRLGENVVVTSCGLVRGARESSAFVFRGIPYSVPPTGNLRWKPPVPRHYDRHTCWYDVRNSTNYGSKCVQPRFNDVTTVEGSEDCLYLNVWTPSLNPERLLPVMVWIHSGDFVFGSGHTLGMSPTGQLAMDTDTVYVSFNYRLGAFGFLALDLLRESPHGASGNYGIMDQQLALSWVKENIGHFGGNPDLVTVFGHGSGATSIQALLSSPGSSGLFHKAWLTSPVAVLNKTLNEACKDNHVFLTKSGCGDAECLRSLSPEKVSRSSPWALEPHWSLDQLFDIPHTGQLRNGLAIFDGHVIHRSSMKEGPAGPVVPLVIGTTYFDLSSLSNQKEVVNMTWDDYNNWLVHYVGKLGTETVIQSKSLYSAVTHIEYTSPTRFPPLPSAQFARLISDIKSVCPTRAISEDMSYLYSGSADVYLYVAEIFPSHNMKLSDSPWDTFVGWDVAAFFDSFGVLDFLVGQGDLNFQNIIREEIMSFVRSGKPDASRWRTVDVSTGVIGRDVTVTPVFSDYFKSCDFWKEHGFFKYTWSDRR